MSDRMRWRYGDTNPVIAGVDSDTVIEIGDMLWQDVDDAKPASMLGDQKSFADMFLGVAMQRSRKGDIAPVRVATTGVFEFDCPAGTHELGDKVGAGQNTPESLFAQQVARVLDVKLAVGRVAKRQTIAETSVLIDIRSTVMTGGVAGCTAVKE